jgi:hypothetical protein
MQQRARELFGYICRNHSWFGNRAAACRLNLLQNCEPSQGLLSSPECRWISLQAVEGVAVIVVFLGLRLGYMGMILLEVATGEFISLVPPVTQLVYSELLLAGQDDVPDMIIMPHVEDVHSLCAQKLEGS